MALITLEGATLEYSARTVLRNVSLSVEAAARVGVVGPNGSGKTTLLRLAAGELEPTAGAVSRRPGLAVGYLPQDPAATGRTSVYEAMLDVFAELRGREEELAELERRAAGGGAAELRRLGQAQAEFEAGGGYTYRQRIERVLTGLGFPREWWDRPLAELSGGERTRAHLAGLLLREPEVLLLDEPTNHLDIDAAEWLENWLLSFRGALLAVSHDRYFLDRVTAATWEVDGGAVEVYRGAYSHYLRQRSERREARRRVWVEQQDYIRRTQDFIARHIAGQRTKEARGRRAHLEKFLREEAVERPPDDGVMDLRLPEPARCGDLALRAEGLAAGYDRPLVRAESLEILRGERVAIVGPNGSGKTTLLRTLLGQLPPLTGTVRGGTGLNVGYLSQNHAELDADRDAVDLVLEAAPPGTLPEKARGLLGSLGLSGNEALKRPGQLSGGQRSRVLLARLVVGRANLLALDEPTNHLDLPSAEIIQQALGDFEGTVLFVSHDRYLVRRVATRVWVVAGGEVRQLAGGWDAYLAWRASQQGAGGGGAGGERGSSRQEAFRAARRLANRQTSLRRQMGEVEERIDATEKRLAELSEAITAAGQAGETDRVAELGRSYQELDRELSELWSRWEALGEELQGVSSPAAE